MNNTQFKSLEVGQVVRHTSGKLYFVNDVHAPTPPEEFERNRGGYLRHSVGFYGLRDGRRFGPIRSLKAEAIELAPGLRYSREARRVEEVPGFEMLPQR